MALSETRSNLVKFLRDSMYGKADSVATRLYERAAEQGLKLVSRERYWSFMQDEIQVGTTDPYTTGTVDAAAVGATSLTITGATLPSDIVSGGAFLEIDGNSYWYEITVRGSNTALTIRSPGLHAATTGTETIVIAYPRYDLPANFRRSRKLIDLTQRQVLRYVSWDEMRWAHNEHAGTGNPLDYSIQAKRNDPNIYQLWIWPAPDTTNRGYTLLYWKDAGWYDTNTPATSAWSREAPSGSSGDTYYVDWPERYLDLLRQACLMSLYREVETHKSGPAMEAYYRMLSDAMEDDETEGDVRTLGGGTTISRPRWTLS